MYVAVGLRFVWRVNGDCMCCACGATVSAVNPLFSGCLEIRGCP